MWHILNKKELCRGKLGQESVALDSSEFQQKEMAMTETPPIAPCQPAIESPSGELDFLGVGEILVDFISYEETDNLVNAFSFQKYQGGSPANIAVNISKLQGRSAIVAKTGIGAMGKFIKEELLRAGVSTEYLIMDHRVHTTIVFISRSLGTADSEAFRNSDCRLCPHEVLEEAIERSKIVHSSTWSLSREPSRSAVLKGLRLAREHSKIVSFDPNYNSSIWPEIKEAMAVITEAAGLATIVKCSIDDAKRIFGRNKEPEKYIEKLHSLGPKIVVFTMGAKGMLVSANGELTHVPGRKIKAVDATGAGDALWAGFLVAMLDGNDLIRSAHFAREVVEMKLQEIGPLSDDLNKADIYAKLDSV